MLDNWHNKCQIKGILNTKFFYEIDPWLHYKKGTFSLKQLITLNRVVTLKLVWNWKFVAAPFTYRSPESLPIIVPFKNTKPSSLWFSQMYFWSPLIFYISSPIIGTNEAILDLGVFHWTVTSYTMAWTIKTRANVINAFLS